MVRTHSGLSRPPWCSSGAPRVGAMSASPVVVITGASSGLGRGTALAFAERHARLVLVARGAESLDEVAAECASHGAGDVGTVAGDMAAPAQADRAVDTAHPR